MAKQRNTYPKEYRIECADYVLSSGKSVQKAADELGVSHKTLGNWVRARKAELEGKPAASTAMSDTERELKAAQKRIRELEMENEFLKKASAFFAKNLQ